MAKPTKTGSLRSLITRQIKRMEQRGYNIPESVKKDIKEGGYQRLKSYRDKGYKKLYGASTYEENGQQIKGTRRRLHERVEAGKKGAKTRKAAEEFKRYKERFKDIEGQFDPDTGEIYDEYYKGSGKQRGDTMPQEDVESNVLQELEDFLDKLSQEPPDYYLDNNGKRRYMPPVVKEEIKRKTETLRRLLQEEIAKGRGTDIAQALMLNASEVGAAIERLYGYYERDINSAMTYLATLITNRSMSMSELSDLDAAQGYAEGYEDY